MLFSAIRAKGGINNNSTAVQFEGAYKRPLLHNEIGALALANCVAQDATGILTVSSNISRNVHALIVNDDTENYMDGAENFVYTENTSQYISDVVEYIASFISKKVVK